jgi:D-tyrosyl-tRNA(Tyr) deacylase
VRVLLQRVSRAEVRVEGSPIGRIARGVVLLVGFQDGDGADEVAWMAEKVIGLRVFTDPDGKMNLSLDDVGGDVLVVSQFTLYGDVRKGRRPSFVGAAPPEIAVPLYEDFVSQLRRRTRGTVETGQFGAVMEVDLVNDGPVTLFLERG